MIDLFYILLDNSDLITPYLVSLYNTLLIIVWFIVVKKFSISYVVSLKISLILLVLTALTLPIPITEISATLSQFSFLFLCFGIFQYFLLMWKNPQEFHE